MTTDTELRDLLSAEAGGPTGSPGGWDDVTRRGRHRQRVRRAQGATLAALAVGAVATAVALRSDDPTVDTIPRDTTPTTPTVPEDPTTSTTVPTAVGSNPSITAGRAQGVFLTVLVPAADPATGFDPCTQLHPRVVESPDQVMVELVDETVERGLPWASCESSPFSSWATIELTDPLRERPLLDAITGEPVPVVDGETLLFPTSLPAPFDIQVWDELAFEESWTFAFSAGDVVLNIATDSPAPACDDGAAVEVRGTPGRLCMETLDGEVLTHGVLRWSNGEHLYDIELTDPEGSASLHGGELLGIAEALEPMDG